MSDIVVTNAHGTIRFKVRKNEKPKEKKKEGDK